MVCVKSVHESVVVGVVTYESAVLSYNGVDRAYSCRFLGQFVKERNHSLLIRHGDVESFPLSAFYESFQLLRLLFKEQIVIGSARRLAYLTVYLGAVAVTQFSAHKTEGPCCHFFGAVVAAASAVSLMLFRAFVFFLLFFTKKSVQHSYGRCRFHTCCRFIYGA